MQRVHVSSLLVGGIIIMIFAGGEVICELWVQREERAVQAWPETRCTVCSSEVEVQRRL